MLQANEFRYNRMQYEEKARDWTHRHACANTTTSSSTNTSSTTATATTATATAAASSTAGDVASGDMSSHVCRLRKLIIWQTCKWRSQIQ